MALLVRVVRLSLFVVALALSFVGVGCGAPLPSAIREEIARTPPGTVTIVFFTDFQCPFCRRTHAALYPLIAPAAEQRLLESVPREPHPDDRGPDRHVRLVLRHVPLPRHPDARGAARAAICAERTGIANPNAYAHALFGANDLAPETCENLAVAMGAERERFRACVGSPETDARIEADIAAFEAVGGDGVPLLFIGRTRLEGAQDREMLESALDHEARRDR